VPNISSPDDIQTTISLSKVISQAEINFKWDKSTSDTAEQWYYRYLYLCYKYPEKYIAAISHSADDLWHQHIIDTDKYASDCQALFGKFLKHQPVYGGPSPMEDLIFQETQTLYMTEFGVLPPDMKHTSGNYSYNSL
jgi:hypothetical protein